ncbi:histidine phosphatase superfamily [Pyronema omphalodes]|nr:histidine phosphatase superfamily [Pyronema omphalodes]
MLSAQTTLSLAVALAACHQASAASWIAPRSTNTNNITFAHEGPGLNGFVYDSSTKIAPYNYCNMPHINPSTYYVPDLKEYELEYVEVTHRHHKRTPYASNMFPVEDHQWQCHDTKFRVSMDEAHGNFLARTHWETKQSPLNPLHRANYHGSCQFPQITKGGFDDSFAHGRDLFAVYGSKLGFLPRMYSPETIAFHVTSNVITLQVAGALTRAMFPFSTDIPLLVQPSDVDSLQPSYSCPAADAARNNILQQEGWKKHLELSSALAQRLDAISGVDPKDAGWHQNWDHYFDSFSSRMCHQVPLPCNVEEPKNCVTTSDVEEVLRWGQWEYSYLHRDGGKYTLEYSRLKMGVFLAELVGHLQRPDVKYRHNFGHDGSMSLIISALQIDEMVWPGMGAEVVVELWRKRKDGKKAVRVMWGGKVMTSSSLGKLDMVPLETFVKYITDLTGEGASDVVKLCGY